MNSTVVFLLAGVVIFFNLKTTSGFSKLVVLLMFIKFASGTIKQQFGAKLMKNSGSSSNFRVVIVLNMKAMGGWIEQISSSCYFYQSPQAAHVPDHVTF